MEIILVVAVIILVCFAVFLFVYTIYCIKEKLYEISIMCIGFSMLAGTFGFCFAYLIPISTDKDVVYLEKLPDKSQYYNYYSSDDVIEYLEGNELVRLTVNDLKTVYDTEKPFMEKTDYNNFLGHSVKSEVVIHLEELNDE